ncbi:uncharacterized protein LOC114535828 [Dendronephthya gigantea]|uniref:uncharacterized protein LOC114535828 n=1 Tax=Dendronephthya gigantea TaxID=151771 RepID=UPI00106919E1|nr:uncharacterized protein LOC114535828 [Dendronephthya gigantea]
MESTSKSKKRKKSGSEIRKASKARKEENERLGSFMKSYFTTSTKSSDNTNVYNTDDQAPLDAGENNEAEKNNDKRYEDCEANDEKVENDVGYEIEEVQVTVTGASEIQERVEKDNTNVQECAMSSVLAPIESELASYDSYSFIDNEVNKRLNTTIETPIVEEDATRHNTNSANPTFTLDEENETLSYDPAFLVDECLRGGNVRPNQGSAFTNSGFSNWKKQYSAITKHETSESHINAKIAQVVFLQGLSIDSCLEKQEKSEILRRKREIVTNRNVMKRVVDTVLLLGKQGLAFRGHRESLDNPEINRGNYLETLDYLSIYDDTIHDHLERVRNQQALSRNKSGGKRGAKGRGSKLTFLSTTLE